MLFEGWLMAAALAGAAAPASAQPVELDAVEVQGTSAMAREKKTLGQLFKAEALFEKFHALAPQADLKIKVYGRTQVEQSQRLALELLLPEGRQPVTLDAADRFVVDPAWRALDENTELRSRLADGRVTWRPDIRTPGWPAGERRLGDLQLQCRAAFDSGIGRGSAGMGWVMSLVRDECTSRGTSPSNFADEPVFAVTLVHGDRRVTLSNRLLHGLRDGNGSRYDWGFALRERMFRLPMGDPTWPDDTRVVFERMDDPPAPADTALLALDDPWARAALQLRPGLDAPAVLASVGEPDDDLRFDSGRRLVRHVHRVPGVPFKLELVSLFNAEGLLQKSELRRLTPGLRD